MRYDPRYDRRRVQAKAQAKAKAAQAPDVSAPLIVGLFVVFAALILATQ